jgi:signal transduction histidine kinase
MTIILISIIFPLLFSVFFLNVLNFQVSSYIGVRNKTAVERAKNEIELFFQNPLNISKTISFNSLLASNPIYIQQLFIKTIQEFPIFTELSLFSLETKEIIYSTDSEFEKTILSEEIQKKIFTEKKPFFSKMYIKNKIQPAIDIYTPIVKFSRVQTVLKSTINLQYIWNLISEIRLGEFGDAFLVTSDQRLVAHKNIQRVLDRQLITTFIDYNQDFGYANYLNEDNQKIIATYAKIDPLNWYLIIEQKDEEANSLIKDIIRQMFLFISIASVLALLIGIVITRKISRPIEKLIQGVLRYGEGDLEHRIELQSSDELEGLSKAFNSMANKIEFHQRKLRRIERFSLLTKMVRMVSHEIRNPLNAMKINLQILKRTVYKNNAGNVEKKTKHIDIISSEITRIDDMISNYVSLAEPPKLDFKNNNIHKILEQAIMLHKAQAEESGVQFIMKFSKKDIFAQVDVNQIKQVFINLFLNAVQAMPQGGKIIVHTKELVSKDCLIIIEDTGCGIAEEKLDQIFEFQYTSKQSGSGIGLSLSKQIIEGHQGSIFANSEENVGTEFYIQIPLSQDMKERGDELSSFNR